MSCSAIMFSLFLVAPCPEGGGAEISDAVAKAVSNPQRPVEDVARDANRKPAEVLSFFNIEPGMTVLDIFSGGGYYTEMLNSIVGDQGKVIAHSNQAYMSFVGDAYEKRYADGRLAYTQTIVSELDDLKLEKNSVDAAMLVLTWHDFMFADPEDGWQAIDKTLLMDNLCSVLKPGGVLGLIDHAADSGGDPEQVAKALHRVDPQVVEDAFKDSCFSLEASADFLANPDDDHSLSVFDKAVRGNTDRFVFRFVKDQ